MKNIWDVKAPHKKPTNVERDRRIVRKFFSKLTTRGGIMNGKAVLFVYCPTAPELSYIVTGDI